MIKEKITLFYFILFYFFSFFYFIIVALLEKKRALEVVSNIIDLVSRTIDSMFADNVQFIINRIIWRLDAIASLG